VSPHVRSITDSQIHRAIAADTVLTASAFFLKSAGGDGFVGS
jgi:hypothetical protein